MFSYIGLEQALQWLFASLGAVVAVGGGSAAVAYAVFCWFGKSWLEQQFQKQLEQLRHDQQKEIEQLRHQINSLFSRISKVHEKEFEILPEAWKLLHEAYGRVYSVAQGFKRVLDVSAMTDGQFEGFLTNSSLHESQKQDLRDTAKTNRTNRYQNVMFPVELNRAGEARIALNNFLAVNSIFMTEDLRQRFSAINVTLGEILIDQEIGRESESPELLKSSAEALGRLPKMFENIESVVQKRLRYEEA